MELLELQSTHKSYGKHLRAWQLYAAAYAGVDALLALGMLPQHPREDDDTYARRAASAQSLDYTPSVVDLFIDFLSSKTPDRSFGPLQNNPLWGMFLEDANLFGMDYNQFMLSRLKEAAIFGHVGILVDMPTGASDNLSEQIENRLYPYLAAYTPMDILDWRYSRDGYGRPYLSHLKLADRERGYLVWSVDRWEQWVVPESNKEGEELLPELVDSGINDLGVIPFVWLYNEQSLERNIGLSDVRGIARLDAALMLHISEGDSILEMAGFPMMRKPVRQYDDDSEDVAGVTSVLPFDPENPSAKPDWLESKVGESITAILQWIDFKTEEIHRQSKVTDAKARCTKTAESGIALAIKFRGLNSKLSRKASNAEEAEKSIIRLWRRYQSIDDKKNEIAVSYPRDFDSFSMAQALSDLLAAKALVKSTRFSQLVAETVIGKILPGAAKEDRELIGREVVEEESGADL